MGSDYVIATRMIESFYSCSYCIAICIRSNIFEERTSSTISIDRYKRGAMLSSHLDQKDVDGEVSVSSPVFDEGIGTVKEKYHGTNSDRHEMNVLGKKQVLRVNPPFYYFCHDPIR